MYDEVVELLVRWCCGESTEPPLHGIVTAGGRSVRIWKRGTRLRAETLDGELLVVHDNERMPVFADEEDPWTFVCRPGLRDLDLDERRLVGDVEHGEAFGRVTSTFTLEPRWDGSPRTLTLDRATGMALAIVEERETLMRWDELEFVDAIDEELLATEGEEEGAVVGWFGYVASDTGEFDEDADVPEEVRAFVRENARHSRELRDELALPQLTVEVPLTAHVMANGPDALSIRLEADPSIRVEGSLGPSAYEDDEAVESWTTQDGWRWILHHDGIDDPALIAKLREHVIAWRDRRG